MDLSYFQTSNDLGQVIYRTPIDLKNEHDLERIITKQRPQQQLDYVANKVAEKEQWQWLDDYLVYQKLLAETQQYNANLPVIAQDEDGQDLYGQPKALPNAPQRPKIRTAQEVLASVPAYKSWQKAQGMTVNGTSISLNENNQNGIAAVLKGIELAEKHQQNIFPVNFNAETANGTQLISFAGQSEFELFALNFIKQRQLFFNVAS